MDVDAKLWDPVMRIRGLWYDGLLDPMPVNRAPNPAYPGVNGGLVLVLGGQQLYGGTSAIEQMFFQTYKYDHVNTFKGAYHINPDYSHWFGWARVQPDIDQIKGEEARLRKAAMPYEPGFTVAPAKPTVGAATTFDATGLVVWGDASPNTFTWQFGDTYVAGGTTGAVVTRTYAAPGRFPVQLTVADTDLVNDAANPATCSALRTTTAKVTVKYGATLKLAPIARVAAGGRVSIKTTLTTAGDASGVLTLYRKVGAGAWIWQFRRHVATKAGVPVTATFRPTLSRTTSYKTVWSGDATAWGATSPVRTVKPL